jgi:hypothetical protein
MEDQGPRYLVDCVPLRPDDAAWQQALERAYANDAKPLCLCRPAGVPMYVARYPCFCFAFWDSAWGEDLFFHRWRHTERMSWTTVIQCKRPGRVRGSLHWSGWY